MFRARVALLVAGISVAVAAGVAGPLGAPPVHAFVQPSGPPVFTHPVFIDAQRLAGEPDISLGHDGTYYASAPWGVTTDTTFHWRSDDGGTQFRQIQAAAPAPPGTQNPYAFRAGGDTEIHVFPPAGPLSPGESAASPSKLYFANQDNLDSNTCGYSTDAGRNYTFIDTSQPGQGLVCGGTVGADRQWITETRVDPTVSANNGVLSHDISYLWYDHYQVGGNTLGRSDDGVSYTLGPAGQGGGNPGNTVADRNTGVVYVTTTIAGGAYVGYSADGGKTLVKTNITGGTDGGCSASTGNTATDFSVIAIDTQGNVYLVYACQNGTNPWRVYFSSSPAASPVDVAMDNGQTRVVHVANTFSTPTPITGPGTTAASAINYAVFPWITAGDPGRVDVAFYGTTQALGYDPNSQPAQWNTYVLQDLNYFAADIPPCLPPGCPPPPPGPFLSAVSEGPTHLSSICFNGIGCTGPPGVGGNRNMLDFFEVTHDANGMAAVVYNDDANQMLAAWTGGPFDMVARQVGGPSLYASVGSLSGAAPPDTNFVSDPSGDGLYPTSDVNVPSLDLLQASATLKDKNTLEVGFTVSNLSNAVAQIPAAEGGIGITYLLIWKFNNDIWFTSARVDASGQFTFWAGRPQSVPFTATGGPKYAVYDAGTNSTNESGLVDTKQGTITIDVPTSVVGGVAPGSRIIDATGFTLVDRAVGVGSLTPALADQADVTTAFDDTLQVVPVGVPEAPWVPAVPLVGAALAVGVGVRRRRRG